MKKTVILWPNRKRKHALYDIHKKLWSLKRQYRTQYLINASFYEKERLLLRIVHDLPGLILVY